MKPLQILKSRSGSALMVGIMLMMMVTMIGLSYMSLTMSNMMRASRDERRATAFYLAEAGLEYVLTDLTDVGSISNKTVDTSSILDGLRTGATGSVVITAYSTTSAKIVSTATFRNITQSIRVKVKIKDVSVWNNAIFAGIGQCGRGINGNVDIRGSVHILGDGEPFTDANGNGKRDVAEPYVDANGNGAYDSGESFTDTDGNGIWSPAEPYQDSNFNGTYDPPLTATDLASDLSGSANIGNNYAGIPWELSSKIPGLTPQVVGSETIKTLNSEVRVKHGTVNLSGTATIGDPNNTWNDYKETTDGVYVTDGYGGNKGASNIYSDNGTNNKYDLGDRLKFPSLLDTFQDPNTGVWYSSYETWLDSHSMSLPGTLTKIDNTVPSFAYTDGANAIVWSRETNTMTIVGIVRFPSNLDLSSKDSTIYFSGKGTIYSKGNVRVHGSVVAKTMFPTTDTMGVIAKGDINFATGSGESQLTGMGAWFAQGKIVSAKQNKFAGTYVADYFDMGTNVPSIYQVPSLVTNLPPGMPGGKRIFVAQFTSWKRL